MKKTIFFSLMFATAALFSCSDDYTDWADPQGFEAEAAVDMSLTVSPSSAINMADVESATIQLFQPSPVLAEGASVTAYRAVIDDQISLDADQSGYVSTQELTDAVVSLYGKRPTQRDLNVAVYATVDVAGQGFQLKASPVTVGVTLEAPVIDSAYYLVGDMVGWDDASMVKFNHSSSDVYDDPYFTLVFTTTADNQYWKIIPQSNVDAGNIWADGVVGTAVDGDEALEGALVNSNPGAGKIAAAGMYKMTLNMMDYTYTLEAINFVEAIYLPGNQNGWSTDTAPALLCSNNDGDYKGLTYLNGDFKFTRARNWDSEYNFTDFTTVSDNITQGDGTNIRIAEGYYYLHANMSEGSLTATSVVWGLVGPATVAEWTPSAGPAMTYNSADDCWEITTELKEGEWKFVANKDDSWAINLGGTADDLNFDGANLSCTEAGTYTIKLYTSRSTTDKMYCTVTKQ
jgi:hypothetical protein